MTVRELQTLALVAEGKPYGVIAEHLHVSYKTVANTCTQLKAKLGVRTLPELMRIAIQHLPSASAKTLARMVVSESRWRADQSRSRREDRCDSYTDEAFACIKLRRRNEAPGAPHTNRGSISLDTIVCGHAFLMQCSEDAMRDWHNLIATSTFHLQSHYIWQL